MERRRARSFTRLIVSAIEHPSVLSGGRFAPSEIEHAPVTPRRRRRPGEAARPAERLAGRRWCRSCSPTTRPARIQPVAEAAAIVHGAGGILHVDAVQALGRVPLGCCRARRGPRHPVGAQDRRTERCRRAGDCRTPILHMSSALIRGGGQERNRRAGTENVVGIAGFGAAAEAARGNMAARSAAHARPARPTRGRPGVD